MLGNFHDLKRAAPQLQQEYMMPGVHIAIWWHDNIHVQEVNSLITILNPMNILTHVMIMMAITIIICMIYLTALCGTKLVHITNLAHFSVYTQLGASQCLIQIFNRSIN